MFRDILTESQQTVLELLSRIVEVRTFYLAGGTALALHLGHRRSGDFDFFRSEAFPPQDLLGSLRTAGDVQVLQETAGTLTVMLQTSGRSRLEVRDQAASGRRHARGASSALHG